MRKCERRETKDERDNVPHAARRLLAFLVSFPTSSPFACIHQTTTLNAGERKKNTNTEEEMKKRGEDSAAESPWRPRRCPGCPVDADIVVGRRCRWSYNTNRRTKTRPTSSALFSYFFLFFLVRLFVVINVLSFKYTLLIHFVNLFILSFIVRSVTRLY